VYPNPSEYLININSKDLITSLVFKDLNGKTIKTESFSLNIPTSNLTNGLYQLTVVFNNGLKETVLISVFR
jgi:hypothetical protein